jgi:hypothetical protein
MDPRTTAQKAMEVLQYAEKLKDVPSFLITPTAIAAVAKKMGFSLSEGHASTMVTLIGKFLDDDRPPIEIFEDKTFMEPFYGLIDEATQIIVECPFCQYSAPMPPHKPVSVLCPSCSTRFQTGVH